MLYCASFYVLVIGISILSDRVRELNIQTRFAFEEDAWPPNQPKEFTPLLLVYHQHTFEKAIAIQLDGSESLLYSKDYLKDSQHQLIMREAINHSKTTKQLVDILAPLQDSDDAQFILVEGLPGIGKSLLLQEIAYGWAKRNFLQKFKIVLLVQLRSPAVQQVSLVADLFQLVCKRETRGKEIATACSEYLFENNGKDVVFLFDGYDEFPEHLQKDSLVADILKRKVLPHCGLVVSSRPHASVSLRQQATIKVEILGFAEEERKLYIEQSLKGQPQRVKQLTEYLEHNLTINNLCFIPFNMVILIYLCKQGIPLPSNSMLLYSYFIYLTICRHLAKFGNLLENTIPDLANLPEPCYKTIQQLSKLALEGINNNKLFFTLQEMRAACQDINTTPGVVNGFGLLQAVQHFGLTGKTTTFNFVHFSIQEFLAAYHITQLPLDEELLVLKAKFWGRLHSNMFLMYTSLTNGQRSAFKQFLSGGNDAIIISETFLRDQLKCLHLFHTFHEAKDETMYTSIQQAQIFSDKVIDLHNTSLSPYDIECVTLFLTCSPYKKWKMLNLRYCHLQDHGLRMIHHGLRTSGVTIRGFDLSCNGLTKSSSCTISDLTIHCGVEALFINGNYTIGEDPALFNMLSHPSSRLVTLDLWDTSLSSPSAVALFDGVAEGNRLQQLNISYSNITDEVCDFIATSLESNECLVTLAMYGNSKISAEAVQQLVDAIHHNNTLQVLWLPHHYTDHVRKTLQSKEKEVNRNREDRGRQLKLNIRYL